jgi:hypothetical protein
MRGKLWFLGGLAAGFVLGARAGRERYEELVQTARKIKEHPTVQEATGVVQEQANRLISEGKGKLSQTKLAETKLGERFLSAPDTEAGARAIARNDALDDSTLAMTGTPGSTAGTTGSTLTGTTTSPTSSGSSRPNTSSTTNSSGSY